MPYRLKQKENENGELEWVWTEDPEFLSRLGDEAGKGVDYLRDMARRSVAPLQDLKDYFTGPEQMYVDTDRLRELQGMFGDVQQPRGYSVMDMMSERHKGGMPFPGGELGQMELELMMGRGLRAPGGDPSQRLVDKMYKKLPRKRGR